MSKLSALGGLQGHFQIILNPTRTPLFQWRLRLFDRLMYCSGCWSYTVGAITTPVFIAIPFLTIWIGQFRNALLCIPVTSSVCHDPLIASQLMCCASRGLECSQSCVKAHFSTLWAARGSCGAMQDGTALLLTSS